MNVKIFKGNFFEIGQQQGEIYKDNGMNFGKLKIDYPLLYKKQLQVYKKYYPEALEELKGVAQAGNFDKDKLFYSFLCSEILAYAYKFGLDVNKACTIFGVSNKNGVFIGRNYDWLAVTENFFQIYKVRNPKINSYIAVSDMGIASEALAKPKYLSYCPDDLVNNKGLFISLTFAYNPKWSYGLTYFHMLRFISEKCSSVEEAIEVFKKVPLDCPKNFFIADKNGKMVVVEHASGRKFKVRYPQNGILIITNHYVDPELAKEDIVLKYLPSHNTFLRYYETLFKINQRKEDLKLADVIGILGDTKSYVCQNLILNKVHIKTIWTLALDMKRQKYQIYWDLFSKRKLKTLEV